MNKQGKKLKAPPKRMMSMSEWLEAVEYFITQASTSLVTHGKNKGHRQTNVIRWVINLTVLCDQQLRLHNPGRTYDGNMAIASLLGLVLCSWYAQVQLAKGFDPNRPLNRRQVFNSLSKFRGKLLDAVTDERIMGKVWGDKQQWNFPFGKGAKGGKFV